MQLQISDEETRLLAQIVGGALRDVRQEISMTETSECMELIKPRERLLDGLLARLQSHNSAGVHAEPSVPQGGSIAT